jgi:hypothetical protein
MQMSLLDFPNNSQSVEHLSHGIQPKGSSGIPHGTVRDTGALRDEIKHIISILDALRTGRRRGMKSD